MADGNAIPKLERNCAACGYRNGEDDLRCEKCGRRLPSTEDWSAAPGSTLSVLSAAGELRDEQERGARALRAGAQQRERLRNQLSSSVQDFRSRRHKRSLPLPFEEEDTGSKVLPFQAGAPDRAPISIPAATQRRPKAALPQIQQEALQFPSPPMEWEACQAFPVAPFRLRLIAHGLDFALTLAALLAFLAPLKLLQAPIVWNRLLLLGGICAYALLVLFYGFLFLYFAGATPSMKWMGLRLVNFDGRSPAKRQLFCRFLGAIASIGSFFLGFLWAAVDEEGLAWHDRISKTFLTAVRR